MSSEDQLNEKCINVNDVEIMKSINDFERHLLAFGRSKETVLSYVRAVKNFHMVVKKSVKRIEDRDLDKYRYWCVETKKYDN